MNSVYYSGGLSYQVEQLMRVLIDGLSALEANGALGKTGERVMLKVNVAGPFSVDKAATTHPEVIRAVIRLIRDAGATPIIGDAPNSRLPCFEISGIKELAKEENVELINYKKYCRTASQFGEIEYARDVLEADRLISIAKLKTHALTHYTGAVKNMFGAVSAQQRKLMHLNEDTSVFVNSLSDVYLVRPADFSITDGIVAMEGMGPTHGDPIKLGVIACSKNAYALDAFCANLIGYNISELPFFIEAHKRGLLNVDSPYRSVGDTNSISSVPKLRLVPVIAEPVKKRYLSMALGSPFFDYEKCIRCRQCANACPAKAIRWIDNKPSVYGPRCIHCYCCNELCPVNAVYFQTRKLLIRE